MGYDLGDRFPFDFESNGLPFGSKSKRKLSPRSDPIEFERRKWKYSFRSVYSSTRRLREGIICRAKHCEARDYRTQQSDTSNEIF